MISVSRAEVCAIACAELFRDAGEIMVSPMTTIVSIGARLARLTFSPDIVLTDGEARLIADTPAIGAPAAIEGWMPFGRVFETLAWGRRHVVMGANQIDRFGNQNLSAFGPIQHPTRQMFGVRGAPGNTINHATSYFVGSHSKRVFSDSVDIVSGIGWDKIDPDNPAYRFVNVFRVVPASTRSAGWCPTWACSTSTAPTTPCGRCRCIPGWRQIRWPTTPPSRSPAWTPPRPPDCRRVRSSA